METEQQDEFSPVAPGEILAEEFLAGYELTQAQLARALGISPTALRRSSTIAAASVRTPRSG